MEFSLKKDDSDKEQREDSKGNIKSDDEIVNSENSENSAINNQPVLNFDDQSLNKKDDIINNNNTSAEMIRRMAIYSHNACYLHNIPDHPEQPNRVKGKNR